MSQLGQTKAAGASAWRECALVFGMLLVILAFLFRDGLAPDRTVFNNDGPLGAISSDSAKPGPRLHGAWQDLNWLGKQDPSAAPSLSWTLGVVAQATWFSKIFAPFALLFLGMSAWFCFRQWKFTPLACLLGGIAAALNGDFLPTACWGVCAQPIAFGFCYLAIGALADLSGRKWWIPWLRIALAGLLVGLNVMEAYDIGAIFSVGVAAFVIFQPVATESGSLGKRIVTGCVRAGIVAGFAAFIAAATLSTLVSTQIQGVGGMGQDAQAKENRWEEATMWSLPKREALGIVVPGLFGFRMSPPPSDNSYYWGGIGRHSSWDTWLKDPTQKPVGNVRYGGGSGYAGALVVVVIFWALFQSFRKTGVFSVGQRRMIWFWMGLVFVSLLLAFGRHAPIFQFFYGLPYASTIRNPAKFLHTAEWALIILFAFGVDALSRNFLKSQVAVANDLGAQWAAWRAKSSLFDRRWFMGSLAALGAWVVTWIAYGASSGKLEQYLQKVGFGSPELAKEIAKFSVGQVGWAVVLYGIALALVLLVVAGCFNGKRARLGGIVLVAFLTLDLTFYAGWGFGSANRWVVTYNWKDWLASHPLIDYLKQDAHKNRVTVTPFPFDTSRQLSGEMAAIAEQYELLHQLYNMPWKQHQFPLNNIRSAEVVQESRMTSEKMAFLVATSVGGPVRGWELTGTTRFLSPVALLQMLNDHPQFDAKQKRFRIATRFDVAPKPNTPSGAMGQIITTSISSNGAFAVFEFGGALPNAKLYSHWETPNDPTAKDWVKNFEGKVPPEFYNALLELADSDKAIVKRLTLPEFNPAQTVLVGGSNAPAPSSAVTNQDAGTVEYASYSPRRVVLRAKAATAAVLMLNDAYNENWHVTVDGKPAPLFRCNLVARGVHLTPGEHTVEFNFATSSKALYVTIAAMIVGAGLLVFLIVTRSREPQKVEAPATTPSSKPAKK